MDNVVGRNEIERAFRSYIMDGINEEDEEVEEITEDEEGITEKAIEDKDDEKTDKQKRAEIAKQLAEKMQERKSERRPQPEKLDEYTYFIKKIMEGKTLKEIKNNSSGFFTLKMDEVFQKFNCVVDVKKNEYYGLHDIYEKVSELLMTIKQNDLCSTMAMVKREIYPKRITCEYGKIDNIILNQFNDNKYKAYYIFSRMKNYGKKNKRYIICFGQKYDELVFDRIKKETEEILYSIANEIRALDKKTNRKREEGKNNSRIAKLIIEMESEPEGSHDIGERE